MQKCWNASWQGKHIHCIESTCDTRLSGHFYQSQNKGSAEGDKANMYKQQMFQLSNGFWIAALHGETVGSPPDIEVDIGQQEGLKHEFLWLHISHVLGGLQQFHPLCTRLVLHLPESCVVETDDGLRWPEKAELHVGHAFGYPFCDYIELLSKLDIDKKWSIHIYELADSERIAGTLKPGQIEVEKKKDIPPYVAWQGAATYKRNKRSRSSKPATSSKNKQAAGLAATLFDVEDEPTQAGQSGQPRPNRDEAGEADKVEEAGEADDDDDGDDFDPWAFPYDDCNPAKDVDEFLWDYFSNDAAEEVEDNLNHAAAAADSGPSSSSGSKEQPRPAAADIPDDTPLEMLVPSSSGSS